MDRDFNLETICVQGGYSPKSGEARIVPIIQSTTYKYDDPDFVSDLFDLKESGHMYSRISNPTVEALEKKCALLDGGTAAVCTSSGSASITMAILTCCSCGDHIISTSLIYGGTYNFLSATCKKFGIDVSFVDGNLSMDELQKYIKPNTKLIFGETIANPAMYILDFEKFSNLAKLNNIPFIVDNSLATPYTLKPLELGANIVVYSATKYMDGHATSVGGVVVDGGNFNWNNGKFLDFVEPDPTYHGCSYANDFSDSPFATKARVQILRDTGCCMSPFNAFLINLGLETLGLRLERHSENALAISNFLKNHPKINWVSYPGLKEDKNHDSFKKYFKNGCGGMLTFGLKGNEDDYKNFIRSLKLISLAVHIADSRTCILQPSLTTHRQLSEEEQAKCGVYHDTVRLSVGIENVDDLINDLSNALNIYDNKSSV